MRTVTVAAIAALGIAGAFAASSSFTHSGAARAASFNCAQAGTPTEIAICADPILSQLDGAIGVFYTERLASDPGLRQVQRGWLKARNVGCGRDSVCLRRMMDYELGWLKSNGRPTSALPRSIGVCSLTTATRVGYRMGDPGTGSAIAQANGAVQVSYDDIPAVNATRVGDPILVCLVGLPQDCPPGDDRGKTYAAANLRTLGAWSAPDSQHMCGGA